MTYHPPKITDIGLDSWINDRTKLGYDKFIELVHFGIKPAPLSRIYAVDVRTIRTWLNILAEERGLSDWRKLYK